MNKLIRDKIFIMKLTAYECQKCHATLVVNENDTTAHCNYCNTDYLIESNQLTRITISKKIEEEKTKRYTAKQKAAIEKSRINKLKNILDTPTMFFTILLGFAFLPFLIMGVSDYFSSSNIARRTLPKVEDRIIKAIDNNDFTHATQELNRLNIPDSFSKNEKKTWKEKQEYYQKLIQEKKREYDLSDPDNILAPLNSKKFNNKTGEEAKTIFTNAGFKKINMIEIPGGGTIFNKKNAVDHIIFGDKTEFTTDDYINKNDPITIYYFEK